MRILAAEPPGAEKPPTLPPAASTLWQGMISATGFFAIAWPPQPLGMGRLRAAWSWLKQTDLIPDKGQFRSRFPHPLSYCCPTTIFRDPRTDPDIISAQHFWPGGLETAGSG